MTWILPDNNKVSALSTQLGFSEVLIAQKLKPGVVLSKCRSPHSRSNTFSALMKDLHPSSFSCAVAGHQHNVCNLWTLVSSWRCMSSCSIIACITEPELIANGSCEHLFFLCDRHSPAASQQNDAASRFFNDFDRPVAQDLCLVGVQFHLHHCANSPFRWNLNSFDRSDTAQTSVCSFRLNLTCGLDSVPVRVFTLLILSCIQ